VYDSNASALRIIGVFFVQLAMKLRASGSRVDLVLHCLANSVLAAALHAMALINVMDKQAGEQLSFALSIRPFPIFGSRNKDHISVSLGLCKEWCSFGEIVQEYDVLSSSHEIL
jgi:hypothetical protein